MAGIICQALGDGVRKDVAKGEKLLREAWAEGDAHALGFFSEDGTVFQPGTVAAGARAGGQSPRTHHAGVRERGDDAEANAASEACGVNAESEAGGKSAGEQIGESAAGGEEPGTSGASAGSDVDGSERGEGAGVEEASSNGEVAGSGDSFSFYVEESEDGCGQGRRGGNGDASKTGEDGKSAWRMEGYDGAVTPPVAEQCGQRAEDYEVGLQGDAGSERAGDTREGAAGEEADESYEDAGGDESSETGEQGRAEDSDSFALNVTPPPQPPQPPLTLPPPPPLPSPPPPQMPLTPETAAALSATLGRAAALAGLTLIHICSPQTRTYCEQQVRSS